MNIHRITLDVPEAEYKILQEMQNTLKIKGNKDLINFALSLAEWAIKVRQTGQEVAAIDMASGEINVIATKVLKQVTLKTNEEVEEVVDNWPELISFCSSDNKD